MQKHRKPHEDICISFVLDGLKFEAVGFLKAGEKQVNGDEMLARTDKLGNVVGKDEYKFIGKYRHKLPAKLRKYFLVTKVLIGNKSRRTKLLFWYMGNWYRAKDNFDGTWFKSDLVLRCCN